MQNNLAQLISEHCLADAQSGNWDAVAEKLNAKTIVVRDSSPLSYAVLTRELGDDARMLIAGTLRAIAKSESPLAGEVQDAHTVLLDEKTGLTIDSDVRQGIIDQLAIAGSWPDDLRNAIKLRGKRLVSVAVDVVTADQCKSAWQIDSLKSEWASLLNEKINPILAIGDRDALIAVLHEVN